MEIFIEIAKTFGVPTAVLVIVLVYHARVVKDKDAELARVNELRVKESKDLADLFLARDRGFTELLGEVDKTMTIMNERLRS